MMLLAGIVIGVISAILVTRCFAESDTELRARYKEEDD